jgi:hypothetical protein
MKSPAMRQRRRGVRRLSACPNWRELERAGELIDPSKRPASSFRSPGQGEDQKAFNPLEIMHAGYTYS